MEPINTILSPLPFYSSLSQQNHRKDYAFGQVYSLITHKNTLLPFQVILNHTDPSIKVVQLCSLDTGQAIDITNSLLENRMSIISENGVNILRYPGILPITEIKYEGQYYLTVDLGEAGLIYSEVFTVCNNVDNCLLLEYYNSKNFLTKNGVVSFKDNFRFRCYLATQIGKPEYIFEEEATERMGYTFIESQVSKKVYRFTFLAPEYLCDALRIVRLCENKQIISKGQVYDLLTFNMEPKWEEQGDLAAVECEFETDNIIANIGGFMPDLRGGDFNKDFNADFDNK